MIYTTVSKLLKECLSEKPQRWQLRSSFLVHIQTRPAVRLTFSRNARLMLPGYAAHPSVHTSRACNGRQQTRTCCSQRRVISPRSQSVPSVCVVLPAWFLGEH